MDEEKLVSSLGTAHTVHSSFGESKNRQQSVRCCFSRWSVLIKTTVKVVHAKPDSVRKVQNIKYTNIRL